MRVVVVVVVVFLATHLLRLTRRPRERLKMGRSIQQLAKARLPSRDFQPSVSLLVHCSCGRRDADFRECGCT
ncbi:hypothetical protein EDD21DRAFT_388001 [Dissophora ornata]|nr:hypothetical protein EDD21DRAFT_388001 [Dissophora ornata]